MNTKPTLEPQPSEERMKSMVSHSSATECEHTSRTFNSFTSNTRNIRISDAVKRRALAVIQRDAIDAGSRNIIRCALEINDPSLAELVLRVDAGESIVDNIFPKDTSDIAEDASHKPTIETLVEMICGGGDDPGTRSMALLVLMGTLQNADDPKALANAAKHLAFTQCGELNAFGMVDTQIGMFGRELLTNHTRLS
jgi:hypothetical protein